MNKTITYVKYANRRIYDTEASTYVSFARLRVEIMEGNVLRVLDSDTKNDVTRDVLISILLEESLVGDRLFTEQFMRMIIRFYGNPLQNILIDWLEQNIEVLNKFLDATTSKNDAPKSK